MAVYESAHFLDKEVQALRYEVAQVHLVRGTVQPRIQILEFWPTALSTSEPSKMA